MYSYTCPRAANGDDPLQKKLQTLEDIEEDSPSSAHKEEKVNLFTITFFNRKCITFFKTLFKGKNFAVE